MDEVGCLFGEDDVIGRGIAMTGCDTVISRCSITTMPYNRFDEGTLTFDTTPCLMKPII